MKTKIFDVVIVGAGHAGLEAAFACAKQNLSTALVTLDESSIALTPCNPSIGGPAKGIVTREIDILGGMQARAADETQLQMKLLNSSKGPGVWALRAQIDKVRYHEWFVQQIAQSSINLIIDEVQDIIIQDKTVSGLKLRDSGTIITKYVILTTGTYMNAITHKGSDAKFEGPDGLASTKNLSQSLINLGFKLIRLKTGTPARIKKSSIDFRGLTIEPGTDASLCFSHFHKKYLPFKDQIPCHIIHTNEQTHKIIQANLKKSAMYGGMISGTGPRYCPSIEDKIVKFSDKPRHQIFLEPESRSLDTIYLGGFSTSMPIDVQDEMIRTLPGLKDCEIVKYGYAIEYDAIDPRQLKQTLETKIIKNLYFAGQINGTSGYEEAAAQGLMAAINVANNFYHRPPLVLKRHEAYIGVMIDDITTKGVTDPYRLLTSRAEYRLNLRNDNADDRLIAYSYQNKMISQNEYDEYLKKQSVINSVINELKTITVGMVEQLKNKENKTNQSLYDYLKRPEIHLNDVLKYLNHSYELDDDVKNKINIMVKFDGYIKRQNEEIAKIKKIKDIVLSDIQDYHQVDNLSLEAIDKLNKTKPETLDQASRISGINIADLITIKVYLEKRKQQ